MILKTILVSRLIQCHCTKYLISTSCSKRYQVPILPSDFLYYRCAFNQVVKSPIIILNPLQKCTRSRALVLCQVPKLLKGQVEFQGEYH